MIYLAIISLLALFFFNAFGISKIYKRFFNHLDIIKCYTFAIISTFAAFCVPIIPLLFGSIPLIFLKYYFLGIQIILLLIYIINWRWFFITWVLDWKKILYFIIIFIAVGLGWFFTNQMYDIQNLNFTTDTNIINFLSNAHNNEFYLFKNQANLIDKPLFYNVLLAYLSMFDLNNVELNYFTNIFSLITYLVFLSFVIMSIFYKNKFNNQWIGTISIVLIAFACSFFNMTLSNVIINFSQYFLPLLMLLIWVHYAKFYDVSSVLSSVVINLIVFMAAAFNLTFIIPFTVINIITIGISYYIKKEGATDYNIFNLFSLLSIWSLTIIKIEYLSIAIFILLISFYIFYCFYRTSKTASKINGYIDNFFYKWITMIIIILVASSVLAIIIYYIAEKNFEGIINNWTIQSYFNINNNNQSLFLVINIFYWIINISIFIYCFITIYKRRRKNSLSFKYLELTLISFFIFWNPLSLDLIIKFLGLNIFAITYNNLIYNQFFLVPLLPLMIYVVKTIINNKTKNFYNIIYMGGITAPTLTSILLLNLM